MKINFKDYFYLSELTTAPSAPTTSANIAPFARPLFGNVVRKDLNAIIPRRRRRRAARRRHIE